MSDVQGLDGVTSCNKTHNIILQMSFDYLEKANFLATLKCHGGKSLGFIDETVIFPHAFPTNAYNSFYETVSIDLMKRTRQVRWGMAAD